jgi:hypothetical protein
MCSLFDLRGIASVVCEFKSHNGTSSCANAKLSLLVCILIFTTFPEPLLSVMALIQLTLFLKQLYSVYSIYNPINFKQIYTRPEYVLWEDVCSLFHSCSLIIFSTSVILRLAVFKSSKWDTICLKLVFKLTILILNFTFSSSQQSYSKCTLVIKSLSKPGLPTSSMECVWNNADFP